jgi:hypothetical protein
MLLEADERTITHKMGEVHVLSLPQRYQEKVLAGRIAYKSMILFGVPDGI